MNECSDFKVSLDLNVASTCVTLSHTSNLAFFQPQFS